MSNVISSKNNNQELGEVKALIAKAKRLGAIADRLMAEFMAKSKGKDKATQRIMFKKTLIQMVVISKLTLRALFELKSQISKLMNTLNSLDEGAFQEYEKAHAGLVDIDSAIQSYITNQRNNLLYLNRLMRKQYKVKLSVNEARAMLSISHKDFIRAGKRAEHEFVSLLQLVEINDEPVCQILRKVG